MEPVRKLPFKQHPCLCVSSHVPAVAYTHRHHIHPLYAGGPDVPENVIPLCPTGHDQVHRMIRLFEREGGVRPLRSNQYLWELAVEGYRRMNENKSIAPPDNGLI